MPPHSSLEEICLWLDSYLNHDNIPDYANAHNGLQVANSGKIESVASAVDASLDTIMKAAEEGIDLLIVHHGLFWQGVEMITGSWKEKIKLLLDHDIAVYSSHIPLDIHPEVGNNILLAKEIGLTNIQPKLDWKGINIGLCGDLNLHRDALVMRIEEKLNLTPFTCFRGDEEIERLFIITGGAGSHIKEVHEAGGKNFLSGEGTQWTVPYAEEKKMNYLLANHYATETLGVKKIAELIEKKCNLRKNIFIKSFNQL